MMYNTHATIGGLCLILLAGCDNSASPLTDSDKANIDCLASKTVMEIATAVRTGLERGATSESLSGVQAEFTDSGAQRLIEYYALPAHETYFRAETERRLKAMQNALSNRSSESSDQVILDETMGLAQTCRFEAI